MGGLPHYCEEKEANVSLVIAQQKRNATHEYETTQSIFANCAAPGGLRQNRADDPYANSAASH